jgi:cytochrome b subunit of formate dehydrogenase
MSVTGLALAFKGSFPLSTAFVVSTLHNLVSFILIAGVLAHAYLGTIANPGTWRVLVDGYVNLEWAEHHHPHWFKSLAKDGESEAAAEGREREPSLGTGRIASDKPPEQS